MGGRGIRSRGSEWDIIILGVLNFPFFPLFGFSLFLRELPALSHNLVALCALTSILHILVVFCVRLERFHIAQYGERP